MLYAPITFVLWLWKVALTLVSVRASQVLSTLGFFFGDPAVPEKLKDYSEHHAMYAPLPFRELCVVEVDVPCVPIPKRLTRKPTPFFHSQDLPLPGWCAPRGPSRSHLTH